MKASAKIPYTDPVVYQAGLFANPDEEQAFMKKVQEATKILLKRKKRSSAKK